jgi:diguanylate cyclase (GGDEF)-like protein
MTEHIRAETQRGIDEMAKRLGTKGLRILEHNKYKGLQRAIYFAIGNDSDQTDIDISDAFLDDLPNTKEHQVAVDTYASAVAGRIKCGSPNVFYCRSGIAISVSLSWPLRSGRTADGDFLTVLLVRVRNQIDKRVANCSVEVANTSGRGIFYTPEEVVNNVRLAIDEGQIEFYDPDANQEIFQRVKRQQRRSNSCSQSEIEQFLEGKAYFLGFLAVEQPAEVWAVDPWDAHYLGIQAKDLSLAMRLLKAKGLFEPGSSHDYWKPADELLTKQSSKDKREEISFQPQRAVSRLNLPTKEELLKDMERVLERHPTSALLVIDLDHFKGVNDKKGHSEGDACLDRVVSTLVMIVGRKGRIYRWGSGDEFAVCLPDFSTEEAQGTAERIRRGIEEAKPGGEIVVTTSIGVCASDRAGSKSSKEILDFADKAMYKAKERRNRVIAWPLETNSTTPPATTEKQGKQAIKVQLAQFLKEGKSIQDGLEYSNPNSPREKEEWERRVERYLGKNLDETYTVRFQTPSHQLTSFPVGISSNMISLWANTGAKMAMLNDFISELRD